MSCIRRLPAEDGRFRRTVHGIYGTPATAS
jgi:hypothetical protein